MSELVSVVIPTKNRSKELQRAINSVLKQTHQEFEILIVDDKSEDNIKSVVEDYNDPRLIYFLNNSKITNANVCRNIGIENANGVYIAMLDSDDEWLPNHLESKIHFLRQNQCDGCFGSAIIDFGNGKKRLKLSRDFKPNESMVDYFISDGSAQTSSYFFTSKSAVQIKWDENLLRQQDYDYAARYFNKFTFLPSQEVSSIIHWQEGIERKEDIDSFIRFLKKHKNQMSPNSMVIYTTEAYLRLVKKEGVNTAALDYLKSSALEQIKFMSFASFILLKSPRTLFEKSIARIEYILRLILKH